MVQLSPADLNILLVEPSVTQRKVIARELAQEGIDNVDFADTILNALEQIKTSAPDLVISALHLADGSALELLENIKNHSTLASLPFMLVSSETRKPQLEEFKQSGVIAILPKPFTREHLGRAINATLDVLSPQELELDYYDVHDIRVLVVDDSRLARNHIMRVLNNLGVKQCVEAEDGQAAIDILTTQMFDLIVTDYNMPQINGKELTEYIRNSSEHSHLPVLMVTSEANDTHLSNIAQSGVNAMCDKPFEPQTVRKLLYQLLDQN